MKTYKKSMVMVCLIATAMISMAFTNTANISTDNNGIEVVVDKNLGFVLTSGGFCNPIPETSSTLQRKNGDIHMWTVLYQAPEGCGLVPDKGKATYTVNYAGNSGTLIVTPSGRMISKFVGNRGF